MSKVGLHDSDATKYPNLALMKLSADHKAKGDQVEWWIPLHKYKKIYSSKVFSFTEPSSYMPDNTIKGGTGYGLTNVLPDNVEHIMPDYSLYPTDYSMGFLTRGCNRRCSWCVVPAKEGKTRKNADVTEFLAHKDVVLMDNNVLQHDHGIAQIEKMGELGVRVDFNQGLDARLIDDQIARRLGKLKWISAIRLACDHKGMMKVIERAVRLLRWHNANPARIDCYVLVKDIDDALERVKFLKGMYVLPFAQPYIDKDGTPATQEQKDFARWCNNRIIYKSCAWEDYKARVK